MVVGAVRRAFSNNPPKPLAACMAQAQQAAQKVPIPKPSSVPTIDPKNVAKLADLDPTVKKRAETFLVKAKEAGFNLRITDGYRSFDRQNELYAQGRTKAGSIVTNAKGGDSLHNFGMAFDVVDKDKGYNIDWNKVGQIGRDAGLEWGGDWKSFQDRPHFQYTGGYSLKQVQKGSRPTE
jgi:peptidoglycan L-alanyl-D-glutamate endopeptidase CwlK